MSERPFDEALVRRLLVLKVWTDVIGYLTTPVDVPAWVEAVSRRFAFLRDLSDEERRWARYSRADEWEVQQAIVGLGTSSAEDSLRTDS